MIAVERYRRSGKIAIFESSRIAFKATAETNETMRGADQLDGERLEEGMHGWRRDLEELQKRQ